LKGQNQCPENSAGPLSQAPAITIWWHTWMPGAFERVRFRFRRFRLGAAWFRYSRQQCAQYRGAFAAVPESNQEKAGKNRLSY